MPMQRMIKISALCIALGFGAWLWFTRPAVADNVNDVAATLATCYDETIEKSLNTGELFDLPQGYYSQLVTDSRGYRYLLVTNVIGDMCVIPYCDNNGKQIKISVIPD